MKSEFFSALKKCTIEHSFRDGDNFVTERKLDPMLFAEKMSVDLEAPQFAGAFNDKSPAEKQFASIVMARLKQCAKYTAMTSEKFDGFDPSRKDHCKAALRRLCEAMEIGDSLMRIESFDGKEQLDHCLALFS